MSWINLVLIGVCGVLVTVILLQAQSTGLGKAWGGSGGGYRTKRGLEKFMFFFTIILILIFSVLSLVNVLG